VPSCFSLLHYFQNAAKSLLGNPEVQTEQDRDQVRDQCSQMIGTTAAFKLQVRQNDDQVIHNVFFASSFILLFIMNPSRHPA